MDQEIFNAVRQRYKDNRIRYNQLSGDGETTKLNRLLMLSKKPVSLIETPPTLEGGEYKVKQYGGSMDKPCKKCKCYEVKYKKQFPHNDGEFNMELYK
jgi:hypothetical protein